MRALLAALAIIFSVGAQPQAQSAGSVRGRVHIQAGPALRTVSRYAGAGGEGSHSMERVPAVVYLEGVKGKVPAAPARPEMSQRDTTFAPELLFVPVGTTIQFPNHDPFFHNVFSYSKAKRFDLGRYPRGESKSVIFDKTGVVNVYCEIHKWMRALIVVTDNPYYATVADDGTFAIPNVPAGTYTLVVTQVDRGRKTITITVPPDRAVEVDLRL